MRDLMEIKVTMTNGIIGGIVWSDYGDSLLLPDHKIAVCYERIGISEAKHFRTFMTRT